jgi:hypothetical protein
MRWAANVSRIGEMRDAYETVVGKSLEVRYHLREIGIDEKIMLR